MCEIEIPEGSEDYSFYRCSVCNGAFSSEIAAQRCLDRDLKLEPVVIEYHCSICLTEWATEGRAKECFKKHFENARIYPVKK